MKVYTIYIEDDRYSVPTLLSAELAGDDRLTSFVSEILSRSQHYLAVDAWDGDRHVIRIDQADGAHPVT